MLRNRLYYYLVKPFVPSSARLAMRRWFAVRLRERTSGVWPIMLGSECPPKGWPGWPEGKKFALVLTHDVEGQAGLDRCRRVMELEQRLGFRSSFNFIPADGARVSPEFRDELTRNGFEVGVHDLYHDGKLFLSEKGFSRNAPKINKYLADWGAVGFRSAFMLRNLDWLHQLDIEYDLSTFDTDPFEPQPQGQHTIFPFWVPRPNQRRRNKEVDVQSSLHLSPSVQDRGYVELPYTLSQDSTLFLLLRERHPDIWFQKLDWIAKHGGMALVNVHPDYMDFESQDTRGRYPASHYVDFLKYVLKRYAGLFWQVTARELAQWYRQTNGEARQSIEPRRTILDEPAPGSSPAFTAKSPLAGKRAAVIVYSYYRTDPRPTREAEALKRAGMEVDVFCLRENSAVPLHEIVDGVSIYRALLKRRRGSKVMYMAQYGFFFLASLCFLALRGFSRRYRLVHVHNMPDFLVFSAIVPRLLGAKVILDLHDPMPELLRTIYALSPKQFLVRWLEKVEKWSVAFADRVLTPNSAFREVFVSRGCPPEKIQIVMNSPDPAIFHSRDAAVNKGRPQGRRPFTLMYHGLLVERHGLDLAVRAVARLQQTIPRLELHIYGEPCAYIKEVIHLARTLGVAERVQYHGFRPLAQIADAIAAIDLGIIPNRLTPFTAINLPTRIFEYLASGKPVIAPRTVGITDYFGEDELLFVDPGDVIDLAAKIEWAYSHPTELECILSKGRSVYAEHRWEFERDLLVDSAKTLLTRVPEENVTPFNVRSRKTRSTPRHKWA